ncbi:MAG: (2Fe-2S)-binding protein [Alphaproteobacteria bacterium]|nr:(2Fe-2S)-binding protein [Alphaproteobacteria bacterium]
MFERPASDAAMITILVDGRPVAARDGDSVAAALLAAGLAITRTTPVGGAPRGPYCMMGACFDCLAVIDGVASRQACLTTVREGMRVERQEGARDLVATSAGP